MKGSTKGLQVVGGAEVGVGAVAGLAPVSASDEIDVQRDKYGMGR
jgi:hypothetical protein